MLMNIANNANNMLILNRNFIFHYEISQPSLQYNSNIVVGEFIFHYTINPVANLKQKFIKVW